MISFIEFLNNLINIPSFLIITILISAVMFINGLSDIPNAIATCVSTRSLSPKRALILVITFNFFGILIMSLISMQVAETMFNIVHFSNNVLESLIALSAALIAVVFWVFITWFFGIPSSQSHALIAGISGAAIALTGNFSGINFTEWKKVILGLIIINLLAFALGYIITKLIEKICKNMDRRKTNRFFSDTQIFAAASMSFMNGAQDGQKYMGIFLLGVVLSKGITKLDNFYFSGWLMIYSSLLMTIGACIGGIKVIKTVGTKVVKLEKYQGTAADISSSICLFIASILGYPVSTTHTKSCAIMGVGVSKRISNVNWNVVKNLVLTWIITFPGCGLLSFILTKIFLFVLK